MWHSADLSPSTPFTPALAMHGGNLHMVYADSNHALHHGVFTPSENGGSWTFTAMAGQSTPYPPSLVEYLGKLTCVYRGSTSPYNIYITTLDDNAGTWGFSHASLTSNYGPSVAVHDGLLYCAFAPSGSSALNFATWDGQTWSAATPANTIANPTTTLSPTLAVYNDQLHLLYVNGSAVQHYVYAGTVIPNQPFIPLGPTGLATNSNVAAVGWNGLLYTLLHTTANQIVYSTFDGARWTASAATVGATTSAGPAAAAQGGALQIVAPASPHMTQITGLAGGVAPMTRMSYANLAGQGSVKTNVPSNIFGGSRAYTVEAWVNLTSTSGTQYIVSSFNTAANTGLMALAVHDGKFSVWRNGYWLPSQTTPVLNQWYHVAVTYDGNAYTALYVDGNLESTEINTQPAFPTSTGPVMIGAASNGTGGAATARLQGSMRWAAIWTVARTSEEIQGDIYVEPTPQPGLIALYDFAGGAPADISGHGQTASVSGALNYAAQTAALLVTGSNGLNCGAGNTLSFPGSQAMSMDAWVRPTSVGGNSYVLLRDGEYSLGANTSGWFGSAGGGTLLFSGHAPVLNQWTHIAFTWLPSGNTATGTLYVNGARVNTGSYGGTGGAANSNATTIGCTGGGVNGFHGGIAGVRLWRKALTSLEVSAAMTQSPLGMEGLAANYDFSTTPILDATLQNDPPTNIANTGTPVLGYVTETLSSSTAAQVTGIDTGVSIPYYPEMPAQGYAFTSPPILPAFDGGQAPRTVEAVLTPGYFQSLLDAFHRSLPPNVSADVRRVLASEHAAKLERLFLLARQNPRHVRGAHRFEWAHRGENVVLLHHDPEGAIAEVAVFAAGTFTPVQLWWIQFTLTLVFGFASILGLPTPNSLAVNLTLYITQNAGILTTLAGAINPFNGITVDGVFNALAALWNSNFLMGMLKVIGKSLSWWAITKLALKLAGMFIPGVQELEVATMLVQFTVMAVQLSLLALDYPQS